MKQWVLAIVIALVGTVALVQAAPMKDVACQVCLQNFPWFLCIGYCG